MSKPKKPDDTWQGAEGERRFNPAKFDEAKQKTAVAARMLSTKFDNPQIIPTQYREKLHKKYQKLKGSITSSEGKFGQLDYMPATEVDSKKIEWMEQVGKFYRQVINAMLGRPLEDVSDLFNCQEDSAAVHKLPPQGQELLDRLTRANTAICDAFPGARTILG